MQWIAPSEKDALTDTLEKRLWDTADQFRANSGLKAQEYSGPILGIIFLRFAEVRFALQRTKLEKASASSRRGSRVDEPAAYHADGILYLAPNARFEHLLNLPEASDIGAKVNEANPQDFSERCGTTLATRQSIIKANWQYLPGRLLKKAEALSTSYRGVVIDQRDQFQLTLA
jgi:hypothetical protein